MCHELFQDMGFQQNSIKVYYLVMNLCQSTTTHILSFKELNQDHQSYFAISIDIANNLQSHIRVQNIQTHSDLFKQSSQETN